MTYNPLKNVSGWTLLFSLSSHPFLSLLLHVNVTLFYYYFIPASRHYAPSILRSGFYRDVCWLLFFPNKTYHLRTKFRLKPIMPTLTDWLLTGSIPTLAAFDTAIKSVRVGFGFIIRPLLVGAALFVVFSLWWELFTVELLKYFLGLSICLK